MPIFQYKGLRADGRETGGTIEASGLGDAIARVKTEGVFPSEVREVGIKLKRGFFRRVDETFLPGVTRQLSMLLASGVPLIEALSSLSAEYRGVYRSILVNIKDRVSGGAALHRALGDFGDFFPGFYINMVHSGEQSGTLSRVLVKLADYLEKQNTVKARVRSAMVYPLIMISVSIVVLSFLFTFVIPKIVKIFSDTKSALPFITVMLIFISNIFVKYWWVLAGGAVAAYALLIKYIKEQRLFFDRLLLRLPGGIMQSLYYSRFARTLAFLLDGGLPMLKALRLSSGSIGNRALEASVLKAEEMVAEGHSLHASLEGFPPVFIQLISTGEKGGMISEALMRAADAYDEEFSRRVNRALSAFEPGLILLMAIVTGFIVLAVILPMFQLNQLVK
ncbi:MAG: type II secretion system F family protein [Nitrospirota bacterium]